MQGSSSTFPLDTPLWGHLAASHLFISRTSELPLCRKKRRVRIRYRHVMLRTRVPEGCLCCTTSCRCCLLLFSLSTLLPVRRVELAMNSDLISKLEYAQLCTVWWHVITALRTECEGVSCAVRTMLSENCRLLKNMAHSLIVGDIGTSFHFPEASSYPETKMLSLCLAFPGATNCCTSCNIDEPIALFWGRFPTFCNVQ